MELRWWLKKRNPQGSGLRLVPLRWRIFASMQQLQDDLQSRWWNLEARLVERFGKRPDMEAILFLVGVQEFGDLRKKFTKEEKQDLMHVAVCSLFAQSGYYQLDRVDDQGWPHFIQLKALPVMNVVEQESFMKDHVLLYFDNMEIGENIDEI